MKRKYILLIVIMMLLVICNSLLLEGSYARYKSDTNIHIKSNSGNLICDFDVHTNSTYISSNGYAYFNIVVKNYTSSNVINDVNMEYYLTISNLEGYNGLYKYYDEVGTSNEFSDNVTTISYKFGTLVKKEQIIQVEVKTDEEIYETHVIGYNIDLYCSQIILTN